MDLHEICRTCLANAGQMISIYDSDYCSGISVTLKDMIISCAKVQILQDDHLPKSMCISCVEHLIIAYRFQQICEHSYLRLKEYLEKPAVGSISHSENLSCKFKTCVTSIEKNTIKQELIEQKAQLIDETKEPLYPCSVCTLCFTEEDDLHNHFQEYHIEHNNTCDVCLNTCSKKNCLKKHLVVHKAHRNFLCSICGKCFVRSSDLRVHTRIHTGEKPYPCHNCEKKYRTSFELKEHIKSHSKNKINYMFNMWQRHGNS